MTQPWTFQSYTRFPQVTEASKRSCSSRTATNGSNWQGKRCKREKKKQGKRVRIEKRREEKRRVEGETVRGREREQLLENVTDWVEVRRRTNRRMVEEWREEDGRESENGADLHQGGWMHDISARCVTERQSR